MSSFVLFCLTLLLGASVEVFSSKEYANKWPPAEISSECGVVKTNVTVGYPGCNSTQVIFRACHGACISAMIAIANPPYLRKHPSVCGPSQYRTKPRRIRFNCNGNEELHRVYMPRVSECICLNTLSNLL